jgi:hypothetical protein
LQEGAGEEGKEQKGGHHVDEERWYIGAKLIRACPQQKDGVDGYRVRYSNGYVSWSPKEAFEEAYRKVSMKERSL